MTHTPGPWFVGRANRGKDFLVYAKGPDGPLHIAEVFEHQAEDVLHGPSEANARLLAQAWLIPDLVAALEETLDGLWPYVEQAASGECFDIAVTVLARAQRVIAKAKGA